MKRPSALVLGLLLLSLIEGAAPVDAAPNVAPPAHGDTVPVHDDTVYVAEADPVVVVYEAELDTLVVRAEGQAEVPIAATEDAALDSTVEAQAGPDEPRTSSAQDATSQSSSARATAQRRTASSSGGGSSGVKKGISVAGLVIDRTHSVIGRDFQDAFNDYWEEPEDVSSFTIRIDEQPLPEFGSKIQVSVEGKTLFQAQLRPEYQRIQKAARQAAARTRYYLQEFYEPREVY